MNILIVGGHSDEEASNSHMPDYVKLFGGNVTDGEVNFCYTDELIFIVSTNSFEVIDGHNNQGIDSYQLVIFRGKLRTFSRVAYSLSLYLQQKGIRVINNHLHHRSISKLSQAILMHQLQLATPLTIAADNSQLLIDYISQRLIFPIIIKDTHGSHGKLNFLVKDLAEAKDILKQYPKISFVAQEFIPNDSDYRILVVDDHHLIFQRKNPTNTHLTNTSQGGEANLVNINDFPAKVIAQAHKFAKATYLDIAGVDVMQNSETGEMVFLEINSQPQLLTGAFIPQKQKLIHDFIAKVIASKE